MTFMTKASKKKNEPFSENNYVSFIQLKNVSILVAIVFIEIRSYDMLNRKI